MSTDDFNKVSVYYLSMKRETPNNDYWDYGLLNDFIAGNLWQPPHSPSFVTKEVDKLPKDDTAIVVVPARHHADMVYEINKELQKIKHVVLFLMGDEEASFTVEDIDHPSIHIWVQNPHPGRHDDYNKLGTTYPPQSQEILPTLSPDKTLNLFFSGQITHKRRINMQTVLKDYMKFKDKNCVAKYTEGFTQGLNHQEYYQYMASAKIVPCPSGAVIPDSFRVFEALESMAIPIADEVNPDMSIMNYWDWLFEDIVPFPRVVEWDRLPGLVPELLADYPRNVHQITCWWIAFKRKFAHKVVEQLQHG